MPGTSPIQKRPSSGTRVTSREVGLPGPLQHPAVFVCERPVDSMKAQLLTAYEHIFLLLHVAKYKGVTPYCHLTLSEDI